jgi:hypothetical protein
MVAIVEGLSGMSGEGFFVRLMVGGGGLAGEELQSVEWYKGVRVGLGIFLDLSL